MYILLEALGGLTWLLIGFLAAVAFGSFAREGAGIHRDPSPRPKPQPLRALVLDPAEAPVIAAARRLLKETRPARREDRSRARGYSPRARRVSR